LVEVESVGPACSEDGRLLGPPRLPVRPRSQHAVCAVVANGATTGAMIAGIDAKSIVHLSDVWTRVPDEPLSGDEIAQDAGATSCSVLAGCRIYWPGHDARPGTWTLTTFKPV
jgi:hypothetical protein